MRFWSASVSSAFGGRKGGFGKYLPLLILAVLVLASIAVSNRMLLDRAIQPVTSLFAGTGASTQFDAAISSVQLNEYTLGTSDISAVSSDDGLGLQAMTQPGQDSVIQVSFSPQDVEGSAQVVFYLKWSAHLLVPSLSPAPTPEATPETTPTPQASVVEASVLPSIEATSTVEPTIPADQTTPVPEATLVVEASATPVVEVPAPALEVSPVVDTPVPIPEVVSQASPKVVRFSLADPAKPVSRKNVLYFADSAATASLFVKVQDGTFVRACDSIEAPSEGGIFACDITKFVPTNSKITVRIIVSSTSPALSSIDRMSVKVVKLVTPSASASVGSEVTATPTIEPTASPTPSPSVEASPSPEVSPTPEVSPEPLVEVPADPAKNPIVLHKDKSNKVTANVKNIGTNFRQTKKANQIETRIFAQDVFFNDDKTGEWFQTDTSLVPVADSKKPGKGKMARAANSTRRFSPAVSQYDAVFEENIEAGSTILSFGKGANSIQFSLEGASPSKASRKKSSIVFKNVFKATDLLYEAVGAGVKESVVLKSEAAPRSFVFDLQTQGVLLELSNGAIVAKDSSSGNPLFVLPRPVVYGNGGAPRIPFDYQLSGDAGTQKITLTPPDSFFSMPNLTYPVVVDPTINLYTNQTGAYDGSVYSYYGMYYYKDDSSSYIYVGPGYYGYYTYRGFLDFNTASLSGTTSISSVYLNGYVSQAQYCYGSSNDVYIRKLEAKASTIYYDMYSSLLYTYCGNGTTYATVSDWGSTGSKSVNLGSTAASDFLSAIPNGWFSLALQANEACDGYYSSEAHFESAESYTADYRPYLQVTSSSVQDTSPPVIVSLNSPADVGNVASSPVVFSVTAYDNNSLKNVSVFLNASGSWARNSTNSSISISNNNTPLLVSIAGLPQGTRIVWSAEVCDEAGNCVMASSNRTFVLDYSPPGNSRTSFLYTNATGAGDGYIQKYYDSMYYYYNYSRYASSASAYFDWDGYDPYMNVYRSYLDFNTSSLPARGYVTGLWLNLNFTGLPVDSKVNLSNLSVRASGVTDNDDFNRWLYGYVGNGTRFTSGLTISLGANRISLGSNGSTALQNVYQQGWFSVGVSGSEQVTNSPSPSPSPGSFTTTDVASHTKEPYLEVQTQSVVNTPSDAGCATPGSVTFNVTVNDNVQLQNVSIFHNATGTWHRNATNSSVSSFNNTPILVTVSDLPTGRITWAAEACDSFANCQLFSPNYTLYVDSAAPNITSVSWPQDQRNITSQQAIFSFTATDDAALKNASILFNATGAWLRNATNSSIEGLNNTPLNVTVNGIPEGNRTVWVAEACDYCGRCAQYNANRTLVVDLTPPSNTKTVILYTNATNSQDGYAKYYYDYGGTYNYLYGRDNTSSTALFDWDQYMSMYNSVYRAFLDFNTTSIPSGATITGAWLNLYLNGLPADAYINLTNMTKPAFNYTNDDTGNSQLYAALLAGRSFNGPALSITQTGWNRMSLNTSGVDTIQRQSVQGWFSVGVLGREQTSPSVSPSPGPTAGVFRTTEDSTPQTRPYLEVSYSNATNYPLLNTQACGPSVTFNITLADNVQLANVSIFHNASGAWARNTTNSTLGADMLPWPRSTSRSSRNVPFCNSSAVSIASSTLAPPGWHMNCGAISFAAFTKRRAGAASRCSTKRGKERDSTIPNPAGSTVQPMMSSVPGQVCSALSPIDKPASACSARSTAAAAPSPNSAEEITSALVQRSARKASVHSSTTTTSTTSPGSARASRAPIDRPETPPAQPRPNTGTRAADDLKPISNATRASRLGVAMPVDETVTITSTSRAEIPARSSASCAVCTNSALAPSR